MRIVLTNAGKKEIIIDEIEKIPNKNYVSEEKVKYSPKISIPSKKRDSVQYQIKRFRDMSEKNISEKRLLTENPVLNQNKKLKKSLTIKGPKTLEFIENKKNDFKIIKLKSSRRAFPKELNYIYSIKEKDENIFDIEKINNQYENNKYNNRFSLPLIQKSVPLKDILLEKNSKNINKKVLKKQIDKNENNLINYLKLDKTIKPSFIEKLNKADNDRLVKLDKICQKYFNDRKRDDIIKQNIKEKIKLEYSNDSKYCKENLLNLQKNIQSYRRIYKSYFTPHYIKYNY